MAASRRTEIVMRGDAPSDASARMTNRDLQVMAEISGDARRGRKQRRAKAAARKSAHLDTDGALVESAGMPGIVCKLNHLCRFVPILANDQVRRDI